MKPRNALLIAGLAIAPVVVAGEALAADRAYCREYTKSVRIGGKVKAAYGTACQQRDGSWEIVSLRGHNDLYDDIYNQAYRNNRHYGKAVKYAPAYSWFYPRYIHGRHDVRYCNDHHKHNKKNYNKHHKKNRRHRR